MKIRDIQQALANAGFVTGPVDGIWGRQTQAAVRAFQSKHGLDADGIIGPQTLAALFPTASAPASGLDDPQLVWFQEARRLLGTREKPGVGNNPTILDWAGDQGIQYKSDDIPWCGLFVGHCIAATLGNEPTPSGLLRARAWERFGIASPATPGTVLVFWRKSIGSGLGHVGFYAGEDDSAYRVLGGNQSDSVSLAWIAKDRLVAARWPATVPPHPPKPVKLSSRTESLSWNEA